MADQQSAFNRELQRYLARGAAEAQSAAATDQYAREKEAEFAAEREAKQAAQQQGASSGGSPSALAAMLQDPEGRKERIEKKYGAGSAIATTKTDAFGRERTVYTSPASRKARQEAAKQQYTPEQLAEMESLGESPTAMSRRSVVARAKERRAQQKAAPTPATVTPPAQADTSSFAFKPVTGAGMKIETATGKRQE